MGTEVYEIIRDNDLIEQAAGDWVCDEYFFPAVTEGWKPGPALHSAFCDGAYWAMQRIEAGEIKVRMKGDEADEFKIKMKGDGA